MPKLHTCVKTLFAIFLLTVFTACATQTEVITYTWENNNLSVNFPSNYHTVDFDSVLVITQSENDLPLPGQTMMELMLITTETSAAESAEAMNFYEDYSVEEVTIGSHKVLKLNYGIETSEDVYTMLIVEMPNGKSVEFVPGLGNENFAEAVLATLSFEETTEE